MADAEIIRHVMEACSCSEVQAINLLKHARDDPNKAIARHKTLMKYMPNKSAKPIPSPTSSHASLPLRNRPSIEITPDGGHLYDTSGEVDQHWSSHSESDQLQRHLRTPQSATSLNGSTTGDVDQHRDPMDYLMDKPQTPNQPLSPKTGHTRYTSQPVMKPSPTRQASELSSPSSEYVVIPPSSKPVQPDVRVVEPPPPEQSQAEPEPSTAQPDVSQQSTPWDFVLPSLTPPASLIPGPGGSGAFNIAAIVGALQNGADEHAIQSYFNYFDPMLIEQHINDTIDGIPCIFFATATNNDRILRLFIANGADVNAVHTDTNVPLIAFAIAHSETLEKDTSHILATLLSMGAVPRAIPEQFYIPYFRDLPETGPTDDELKDVGPSTTRWLDQPTRAKLARTIHLTNRYNLERALKTKRPSARHWQIAQRKNAVELLGLPYFLIGQSLAAQSVLSELLANLAVPSKKPLVLVFAGPSGHGKTEMARRLGYLMNLEPLVVDCTIVQREMELFGGRDPYVNAARGTPLNNHLAKHHGMRNIVFLDEFEKTSLEVWQALLLPFDNGEYQDRRNGDKIDCSKTIWVIATNALDDKIRTFCETNGTTIWEGDDEVKQARLMKGLVKDLKDGFLQVCGAPVTGRISAFLPFLTFSPGEQAAIAHKYLLDLGRKVRDPVKLSPIKPTPRAAKPAQAFSSLPLHDEEEKDRYVGNVRLHIRRDASVCKSIAADGYHPHLGARSLITAVDAVEKVLVNSYLRVDEEIKEGTALVDFVVDVNGEDVVASMMDIEK